MGVTSTGSDGYDVTRWFHLRCWQCPKKGIEGGIDSIEGCSELEASDREYLETLLASAGKRPAGDAALSPKPKAKKVKAEIEDLDPVQAKYTKMNSSDLKTVLKNNRQLSTGTKDELVQKCVDGEKHGALPFCPTCKMSAVKPVTDKNGHVTFRCPGYFSTTEGRVTCFFKADEVQRLKPWRGLHDGIRPEESDGDVKPDTGVLKDEFKDLDTKSACAKLIEVAHKRDLSLPKNDEKKARVEAGTALMSTKADDGSWSPEAALAQLAEKFPKGEGGIPCRVSANQKLVEAIAEIGALLLKSPEKFKGRAFVKAADNLGDLDFEIKSGSALSKGKDKVAGIGKGVAEKIDEFLDKGEIQALVELREQYG